MGSYKSGVTPPLDLDLRDTPGPGVFYGQAKRASGASAGSFKSRYTPPRLKRGRLRARTKERRPWWLLDPMWCPGRASALSTNTSANWKLCPLFADLDVAVNASRPSVQPLASVVPDNDSGGLEGGLGYQGGARLSSQCENISWCQQIDLGMITASVMVTGTKTKVLKCNHSCFLPQ